MLYPEAFENFLMSSLIVEYAVFPPLRPVMIGEGVTLPFDRDEFGSPVVINPFFWIVIVGTKRELPLTSMPAMSTRIPTFRDRMTEP